MTIIAPMIKETRGRKSTISSLDFAFAERREYPKKQANKIRVALTRLKEREHPTWEFRTWLENAKLIVVRVK